VDNCLADAAASRTEAFGYDNADRLISYSRGDGRNQTWNLSPVGDWKNTTTNGVTETRTHTPVHEIATIQKPTPGPVTPLVWDAKGNLSRDERGQGYQWDDENRLLSADIPIDPAATAAATLAGTGGRATYAYDALGRRIAKHVRNRTTIFVSSGAQELRDEIRAGARPAGLGGRAANAVASSSQHGAANAMATSPEGGAVFANARLRVNFQPSGQAIPDGFVADIGQTKAKKNSNGLTYGWSTARTAQAWFKDRTGQAVFDTGIDLVTPTGTSTASWSVNLPNGTYPVAIVSGDPARRDRSNRLTRNGSLLADPDPAELPAAGYPGGDFDAWIGTVTVTNGVLTIAAGAGSRFPTLCWLEIGQAGSAIPANAAATLAGRIERMTQATFAGALAARGDAGGTVRRYTYGSYIDEALLHTESTPAPAGSGSGSGAPAQQATRWYHRNHLYSVMALSRADGAIDRRYAYTSHGERRILNAAGTADAPETGRDGYGFTGRRWDGETGLWYFRSRYLSVGLHVFINRDFIVYIDGLSMYISYFMPSGVDPTGLANAEIVPPPSSGDKPIDMEPGDGWSKYEGDNNLGKRRNRYKKHDKWLPWIQKSAKESCVPWRVVYAIIASEFIDQGIAEGQREAVLGIGSSVGPGQVTLDTARRIGLKKPDGSDADRDYLLSIVGSIHAVAKNLSHNMTSVCKLGASASFTAFAGCDLSRFCCDKTTCEEIFNYNGPNLQCLIRSFAAAHNNHESINAKDPLFDGRKGSWKEAVWMGWWAEVIYIDKNIDNGWGKVRAQ
jgi:RHS repeat-associated protein